MCTVADAWTLPINHPTASHISTELEGFMTRVINYRTNKDTEALKMPGPPTPALALALLEGLLTCEAGGRVRKEIE
eukprot:2956621-Pyramimonas_sp.AAC.1